MQIPVHNLMGEITDHLDVRDDVFALPFNAAAVHQAMVRQLANKRQGTASTKTRGEVTGSTGKAYRQKGTGRARRGNMKSPLLRGGGVVFGPTPRLYRQSMPKKMRRLALKSLLSSKVNEGNMKAVEDFDFEKPKAKDLVGVLSALGVDSNALIVTAQSMPTLVKSAGNLANAKVLPSALINVLDLLSYKTLIVTVPALRNIERIWGQREVVSASS
jgi:large subunit ribosomal protein L4